MNTNLPALMPLADMTRMAEAVAKSGLFGAKNTDQALALMLVAQAEGMHPMTACMEFDIIQGRPARKSWAMLARFQNAGGKVEWSERTDKRVAATFSHPVGGSVEVDWTMDRAKLAGLAGKENYAKFPRQMLTARVISEGVRTVYPGAIGGFYSPEEVSDMPAPRDVTPPKPTRTDFQAPVQQTASPAAQVYDAETGEVLETEPTDEQKALWEQTPRYEAWGNEAIKRIEKAVDSEKIDAWLAANKDKLAEIRAVAPDVAMAVITAADMRKKALGTKAA